MRAEKQCPEAEWKIIWKNLELTPTTGEDKANWYKVIHDIIPTNERLHRIRIARTDICIECNQKDTLIHRMTECGGNADNWKRIQNHIARMLRVAPNNNPHEHLIRPQMYLGPPQTKSSNMAACKICVIHNRKTPITKPARSDGLLEKIEVEIVSTFTSEKASGKLSDGPRHATVKRPCRNNL